MVFQYSVLPTKPDAAFPNRASTKRPIIGIVLEKNGRAIRTWSVIDSGADFCLFPASIARALGIPIPNQNATVFSGTAEAPQIAYFDTVTATMWNNKAADKPIVFELYAGFCDTLEHVGVGLLGQEGFFSRFEVSFNYANNFIEVN